MSKQLSRQIDALIVSCALGMACDEAELMRLATEYRSNHQSPYKLNYKDMRSLETDAEKAIALNLEAKINDINYTMIHFYNELGSKGNNFRKSKSIKKRLIEKVESPRVSPRASSRTSPRASTSRVSPKPCSRKTRDGYCNVQGGKRRTKRR